MAANNPMLRSIPKTAFCNDCPFAPMKKGEIITDHPICGLFGKELEVKNEEGIKLCRLGTCILRYPWGASIRVNGRVADLRFKMKGSPGKRYLKEQREKKKGEKHE